jgi:uncharacterized repeat protein (TIGR01451 family)
VKKKVLFYFLIILLIFSAGAVSAENPINLGGNVISEKDQVNLTWERSADLEVTGFNIYRKRYDSNNYVKINAAPIPADEFTFTDADLKRGDRYTYAIKYIDNSGQESDFSKDLGVPMIKLLGKNQTITHEWDDGDTALPGATITYEVEIANEGYSDALQIVFEDYIPDNTTYERYSFGSSVPATVYFWLSNLNNGKGGWTTTEPKKTTLVKKIKWILKEPILPVNELGEVGLKINYAVKINYI